MTWAQIIFSAALGPALGLLWKIARYLRSIDRKLTAYQQEHDAMWEAHADEYQIPVDTYQTRKANAR